VTHFELCCKRKIFYKKRLDLRQFCWTKFKKEIVLFSCFN